MGVVPDGHFNLNKESNMYCSDSTSDRRSSNYHYLMGWISNDKGEIHYRHDPWLNERIIEAIMHEQDLGLPMTHIDCYFTYIDQQSLFFERVGIEEYLAA